MTAILANALLASYDAMLVAMVTTAEGGDAHWSV